MAPTHHHLLLLLSLLSLYGGVDVIAAVGDVTTTGRLITLTSPLTFLTATSFSTHFSFSLYHPHSSLSLLLLPTNKSLRKLRVEFDSDSVKIGNFSCPSSVPIGNRQRLHAFVDYWAGSSRLEVRLGMEVKPKPNRPLIVFPVDFSEMWSGGEVLVGLGSSLDGHFEERTGVVYVSKGGHSMPVDPRVYESRDRIRSWNVLWKGEEVLVGVEGSSNGDSEEASSVVYSWSFRTRSVPKGMHSMPVDPRMYKRGSVPCYITVVSAVMIAVGCCVFVVFMVMFFKVIFTDWDEVLEMEYTMKPVGHGYERVGADVENNMYGNVKR